MSGRPPASPAGHPNGAPMQPPMAEMPVFNMNEMRGVPMAYRQDDGSETPAPVIDTTYHHAYYPAAGGQENNNSSSSGAGHHSYTSNGGESSQRPSLPPSASASATAATPPAAATRPSPVNVNEGPRRARSEGGGAETPLTSLPNRHTGSADNSNANRGEGEESTASVSYDVVVKPVFSPFQQLRVQQQEQQQQQQQHEQQQQQQQVQQVDSYHSHWQGNAAAAPPLNYQQPQQPQPGYNYAYAYGQPQYSQPGSAYAMSPQYSSYVSSSQMQPNTTAAGGYPAPMYMQQMSYPMPYPVPPPEEPAEAQQLTTSPDWNTGLFGLGLDPLSSIDSFICGYCISSAHFNVLFREEQGLYAPMILGLVCVDCFCISDTIPYYFYPWSALAIHTFVIRREMRKRYGISGNPFIVKKATAAEEVTVEGGAEANPQTSEAEAGTEAPAATDTAAATAAPEAREAETETAAAAPPADATPTTPECPSVVKGSPPGASESGQTTTADAAAATSAAENETAVTDAAATAPDAVTAEPAPRRESPIVAQARRTMAYLRNVGWLECGADVLISAVCTPCAIAQHHREMALRGEWPGKIVFSRECFCGLRNQEPAGMPMTHMF